MAKKDKLAAEVTAEAVESPYGDNDVVEVEIVAEGVVKVKPYGALYERSFGKGTKFQCLYSEAKAGGFKVNTLVKKGQPVVAFVGTKWED